MNSQDTRITAIHFAATSALAAALVVTVHGTAGAISCNGDKGIVTCSGGQGNTPNPDIGGTPGVGGPSMPSEPEYDGYAEEE